MLFKVLFGVVFATFVFFKFGQIEETLTLHQDFSYDTTCREDVHFGIQLNFSGSGQPSFRSSVASRVVVQVPKLLVVLLEVVILNQHRFEWMSISQEQPVILSDKNVLGLDVGVNFAFKLAHCL
jgi:hypothetical protein